MCSPIHMRTSPIIGVYDYVIDKVMDTPKEPDSYEGIDEKNYGLWLNEYLPEYRTTLNQLKDKITHVTHEVFENSLRNCVLKFKEATSHIEDFRCISLVQPNKSQKWVTEVAMTKGFEATKYFFLGEEAANGLDYALGNRPPSPKRKENFKNVVIIDDGSFSGTQMANNISNANRIIESKVGQAPTFHILIPFITKTAREKINNLSQNGINVTLYSDTEMPLVADCINEEYLPKLVEILWPQHPELKQLERAQSTSLYWFDHKMPNSMSFPEVIAGGHITLPKVRKAQINDIQFLPNVISPYKSKLQLS